MGGIRPSKRRPLLPRSKPYERPSSPHILPPMRATTARSRVPAPALLSSLSSGICTLLLIEIAKVCQIGPGVCALHALQGLQQHSYAAGYCSDANCSSFISLPWQTRDGEHEGNQWISQCLCLDGGCAQATRDNIPHSLHRIGLVPADLEPTLLPTRQRQHALFRF